VPLWLSSISRPTPRFSAKGFDPGCGDWAVAFIWREFARWLYLSPRAPTVRASDRFMPHPIVLHHFDQSPFSEKIRVIFGFKGLSWKSVLIPRIMPKPDLMPLTGGYRRTPVMQIGADVFCDTQIIIREIERRFPAPTLFPSSAAGVPWALGLWTDRTFFQNTVNLVFGTLGPKVPQAFVEDRSQALDGVSWVQGCLVEDAVGRGLAACNRIGAVVCSLPRASLLLGARFGLLFRGFSVGPSRPARTPFRPAASHA
jgi:glutathione S-transferase